MNLWAKVWLEFHEHLKVCTESDEFDSLNVDIFWSNILIEQDLSWVLWLRKKVNRKWSASEYNLVENSIKYHFIEIDPFWSNVGFCANFSSSFSQRKIIYMLSLSFWLHIISIDFLNDPDGVLHLVPMYIVQDIWFAQMLFSLVCIMNSAISPEKTAVQMCCELSNMLTTHAHTICGSIEYAKEANIPSYIIYIS